MKRRIFLGATIASVGAPAQIQQRGARVSLRFNLAWKIEGAGAGYLLAKQQGYYSAEGLDVVLDTGTGSAATVGLVASGAYDCASADLASMIEFKARYPSAGVMAVAIQYDRNPNAILVRAEGPIRQPIDLVGRTILGQPSNSSRKLLPVLSKANGFDDSLVRWESAAPGVADTLFAKGEYDGVAYFYFTGLINLKARGMPAEKIRVLRFSDFGVRSYGSAIVASTAILSREPDAMRAFVRASTKGWIDAISSPEKGAAAVKEREPLCDEQLELERIRLIAEGSMRTSDTLEHGWGAARADRLAASLAETEAAFSIPLGLTIADIWNNDYLPIRASRMLRN